MAGVQVSHSSNFIVTKQGLAMREAVFDDTFSSLVSVTKQLQEGTRQSSAIFESAVESQVWQLGKHQTKKKTSRLGTLTELKMISISCTVSMTKGKSSCMLDILTLQCGSI